MRSGSTSGSGPWPSRRPRSSTWGRPATSGCPRWRVRPASPSRTVASPSPPTDSTASASPSLTPSPAPTPGCRAPQRHRHGRGARRPHGGPGRVGLSSRGELVAKLFAEHYSDPFHEALVEVHWTVSLGSGRRRGLCLGLVRAGAGGSGWSRRSRPRSGRATSRSSLEQGRSGHRTRRRACRRPGVGRARRRARRARSSRPTICPAPSTWRRWPSASATASSGSAAAPVTRAWMMSPQCSRIDRRDPRRRGGHLGRVVRLAAARRWRDPGFGVDQVVEPGHQRLLGADAVVHGLSGHARRLGDVPHARAGVAALGEQPAGRREDLVSGELRLASRRLGGFSAMVSVYHLTNVQLTL